MHNHDGCIQSAVNHAISICSAKGTQFTELRKKVLECIWKNHEAVKAYDILEALESENYKNPKPPTVYRTLDFLQDLGLIHRLESLNAFVGCPTPGKKHQGGFLICQTCGSVEEINAMFIENELNNTITIKGFVPYQTTLEIHGLCLNCQ